MILINKVTPFANETFQKNLMDCLVKNADIGFITNIVVFYNNTNIVLPKINKVKLVVKNGYSDYDIIEYCKRIYKDETFIFANPFTVFNNSLIHLEQPVDITIKLENGYIFNRNTVLDRGELIDSLFLNTTTNSKIITQSTQVWSNELRILENSNSRLLPKISTENKRKREQYLSKRDTKYIPNLNVIIVSVNYNDFLPITLRSIPKEFSVTVVTSKDDRECQSICESLNIKYVISERLYENESAFNKGKAINDGIKSIKDPDWILLLDADIYLKDDFLNIISLTNLTPQDLFICKRLIVNDHDTFIKWKRGENVGNMERAKGYGFFHLFNIKKFNKFDIFPENYNDASFSDLEFRDMFDSKKEIETYVVHLGPTHQNWSGRKTSKFTKDEFDINEYFDKIYCINLDNQIDRWIKVSEKFSENSIKVERFSAISGSSISDDEFNRLNSKSNPKNITGESASYLGLFENKNSLACLLSHLSLIKNAKRNNYKRILIFEDDVILCRQFKFSIQKIVNLEWKMLYLGASQFDWRDIVIENDFYRCKNTLGTFAYAIDSSMYDEIIQLLDTKSKSVDNLFSQIQSKTDQCYVFYPNIVISDVENSDIRQSKNLLEYAKNVRWNIEMFSINNKKKILLMPDVQGWAFDNIANSIVKYNPYPDLIEYQISYTRDKKNLNLEEWDIVFVMFEAERDIPDAKNVIRGCYSAFWLEDGNFSELNLAEIFSRCAGVVFANDYLKSSITKYLPDNFLSEIIHDSSDENLFYPIINKKREKFTAIFVGNKKRKIKNYQDILYICERTNIDLITCTDVPNDKLVNYYNEADICINFSDFEGGPQTFLESSLCEVPMLIKSNNELSKLIPSFTGDSTEDFINIINNLKTNRQNCVNIGQQARNVVIQNFTYRNSATKFAKFFLKVLGLKAERRDISSELTIFIIRSGNNPNYEDCLRSLNSQSCKFIIKEIVNVAPMSKAFQSMIDDCQTKFYIQVDEDMILENHAIEKIYESLLSSSDNISIVAHMLKDHHLNFNIYGIKGYKHEILSKYPYNLNVISCEVEQMKRLQNDGYETLMYSDVLGLHSPKWTNELIFERYFDLMEKWKIFKYAWMDELPSKLFQIFQNDNSELNLYALMGAMSSISKEEPVRDREKNFLVKDENFERICRFMSKKDFNHIKNTNNYKLPEILNKN